MKILGISAYYHDSAAALIIDGKIIAAVQEERFSRIKHDASFPILSCDFCLKQGGLTILDIDYVIFYEKPFLKFERLLENYYQYAPRGLKSFLKAMPTWLKDKLHLKRIIQRKLNELTEVKELIKFKLLFSEHHLSHAASAYLVSPFTSAAIVTIDGVGEWATTSIFKGNGTQIEVLKEMHYPNSIGLLYSSFTYFIGFKVNSGEYKLMGLAPYANVDSEETKRYITLIESEIVTINTDGSINLNERYFSYTYGLKMVNTKRWEKLFAMEKRKEGSNLNQQHANLAYAIQFVTEKIILSLLRYAKELTGESNLCLAGGVALNCVANGKILEANIFKDVYIQPAAGDSGCAIGAAMVAYHLINAKANKSTVDLMQGALLGPKYDNNDIKELLDSTSYNYIYFNDFSDLVTKCASLISEGNIIGWFQGAMEFGPRALGNRSILADPRIHDIQNRINTNIKQRENFRPFAPAVIEEDAQKYFTIKSKSPYMLYVSSVNKKCKLPHRYNNFSIEEKMSVYRNLLQSTTHVDFSARIQTVNKNINPRFYQLLQAFKQKTTCSVLLNTSFNVRSEPIVCSPYDAIQTFQKANLDVLVLNDFLIYKE